MKNVFEYSKMSENMMTVEYELPFASRRIDVMVFGEDELKKGNVVLVELKQWSNEKVRDCEADGNLQVEYSWGWEVKPHPSLQVEGYYYGLTDYNTAFQEDGKLELSGCAYCHNYTNKSNNLLQSEKFRNDIQKYPVFLKEEVPNLSEYIRKRLSHGDGAEVLKKFNYSPIRPSKKLLEHTKEMLNQQQVFNLIDDQIVAYNAIMHNAKKLAKDGKKSVIIVKGGPGTGKSVIALQVMAELMSMNKIPYHATGSSAFTKTLQKILGSRLKDRFRFFYSFSKHQDNEIDVLICDEAHRIRKDSNNYGVPNQFRSKEPQINDLIRPAMMSIFFIDEHQVVRPNEVGSTQLIRDSAKKFDAEISEFDLKTQFRCSGSDSFLQWVENILGITETEKQFLEKNERMDFKIFSSPLDLKAAIDQKNLEKKNCARIVAGFNWRWSEPKPDKSLVNDVVIGDFKMPWEQKNDFWKWATDDTGMQQVGTVYTAQGFEFDYIGVIFGEDLVYEPKLGKWKSNPDKSFDNMVKRNNSKFTQHLQNVYRVLMSRAHKGCYVYFMDKNTENYFRSKIRP
ncbi:MAG: DUF2075 domain-containing protein [Candidatus Micrarchaeota archaeon]